MTMRHRTGAAGAVARVMVVVLLVAGLVVVAPRPASAANVASATFPINLDTGVITMNNNSAPLSLSATAILPTFDPTTHYLERATLNWDITVIPRLSSPGIPGVSIAQGIFVEANFAHSFRASSESGTVRVRVYSSPETASSTAHIQGSVRLPGSEVIRIGSDGQFNAGTFSTALAYSGGQAGLFSGQITATGEVTVVYDLRPLSEDVEAPEPPEIDDIFVQCASEIPDPSINPPIADDGIGIPIVGTATDEILEQLAPHKVLLQRTWSFTDYSGNVIQVPIRMEIVDVTAPGLSPLPNDIQVVGTPPPPPTVVATDNCEGNLPVSFSEIVVSPTLWTRTWSAVDANGNAAAHTQSISITPDTTAPTVTVPATIMREASSPSGAFVDLGATATDDVDGVLVASCTPGNGTYPIGVTNVTCTATDEAGNTGSASSMVTVQDTTAPTLSGVPGSIVEAASSPAGKFVSFPTPTASDQASTPSVGCSPASQSFFPVGTTSVTCTATDGAGNQSEASFDVTVTFVDVTAPVVSVASSFDVEATGPDGAVVILGATAVDDIDGVVAVTCVPGDGLYPLGTTGSTCTASDAAGNSGSAATTVTVRDTTAPVFGPVGDVAAVSNDASGRVVDFDLPVATDAVSDPVVECTPVSGAVFVVGTTPVSCTATDGAGNQSEASFDVTVTFSDNTPPVVEAAQDQTVEATGPDGAVAAYDLPSASDTDGVVSVECDPPSGATFPLGVTNVTCTATDASDNFAASTFAVSVVDTTSPAFAALRDLSVETSDPTGRSVVYDTPTTTDAVSDVAVMCDPAPGSGFPVGDNTVTCTASDAAGNQSEATFVLTVNYVDTEAPILDGVPDRTVQADGPDGAVVDYDLPSAFDEPGDTTVTCEPPPGSTFPIGTTTVTCTANDAAGNVASVTFDITVGEAAPEAEPDSPVDDPDASPEGEEPDGEEPEEPTGSDSEMPRRPTSVRLIPVDPPDPIAGPLASGAITWRFEGDEVVLMLPASLRVWFHEDHVVTVRGVTPMESVPPSVSTIRIPVPRGVRSLPLTLSTVLSTGAPYTEAIVVLRPS